LSACANQVYWLSIQANNVVGLRGFAANPIYLKTKKAAEAAF